MKKFICLPILASSILFGCSDSNVEKASEQVVETETKIEKVPVQQIGTETDVAPSITGLTDTVISMYTAASNNNIEEFQKVAGNFDKDFTTDELLSNLAEMLEYKGGLEEVRANLQEVEKEELTPFYLKVLEDEFGSYGINYAVVAEWSFNNDIEPVGWIIHKQKNENKVIRRDTVMDQGNKFTFFEGPVTEKSGTTIDNYIRQYGRNTLYEAYRLAQVDDYETFKTLTKEDINVGLDVYTVFNLLAERIRKAGDANGLLIEEIPHDTLNDSLRKKLEQRYGPDFAFIVEWMNRDYMNIFILAPFDGMYYIVYWDDEGKDQFLREHVNSNYKEFDFKSYGY
ncbi:hypothetical protein [Bacillus sp. FJAT-29937]|uniref:hypothetical protein n=1 Tax=Bacillus sp. FJAT-29937 TaxID=1720553 RepID=UPI00082FCB01|nr:hypothetical protein [Bacillus sp. FJAT-29937]